jgi:hypothetical protein
MEWVTGNSPHPLSELYNATQGTSIGVRPYTDCGTGRCSQAGSASKRCDFRMGRGATSRAHVPGGVQGLGRPLSSRSSRTVIFISVPSSGALSISRGPPTFASRLASRSPYSILLTVVGEPGAAVSYANVSLAVGERGVQGDVARPGVFGGIGHCLTRRLDGGG